MTPESYEGLAPLDGAVDTDARIVRGYTVIQVGPLRDLREQVVDETTLAQVVSLGNAQADGVKTRWTHPQPGKDPMGTYLGRTKRFRIDGDRVRADLHFSEAASQSPVFERDPVSYILTLAAEDPDAFAASIYYMRDRDGDDDGMRIAALEAIDLVDRGAATDGFLNYAESDERDTDMDKEEMQAQIDEAKAAGIAEGQQAERDRLSALREAFADRPDFALDQFAMGHDVVTAKAELADILQGEKDELAKKVDQQAEQLAQQVEEKPEQSEDEEQEGLSFEETKEEQPADFMALARQIKDRDGLSSMTAAMSAASKEHPEAYQAYRAG